MTDLARLSQLALQRRQAGDLEGAESGYRDLLARFPRHATTRRDLAWLLFERGDRARAIDELRRAVADEPSAAALHSDLGTMLRAGGSLDEAVDCFRQAIGLDPALWQARYNLGNAYVQLRQFDQAVDCYAEVLRHAPADPDVHLNLGVAERSLGHLDRARESLERARDLRPADAAAWTQLGILEKLAGNIPQAIDCLSRARQLDPGAVLAYYHLGLAWRGWNHADEAIEAFRAVVRLSPNHTAGHRALAEAYESSGRTDEAIAAYRAMYRCSGDDAAKIRAALALPIILESAERIDRLRRQLARDLDELGRETLHVVDPVGGIGTPAFPLAYQGRNERDFQRQISALVRRATPGLAYVASHCANARGARRAGRVKLGFISMHFRDHTIGKLNAGLIKRLDRAKFEVVVFHGPDGADPLARRILAAADASVVLAPDLAAAREQIADQRLDVLYYTDIGLEPTTYYLAHAQLARVQCVTWGHPLTTGIPAIDYFISSDDLETVGAEAHYTEKLVRLAHLAICYYRPHWPTSVKARADFGLSDESHVYACLQGPFKLHPDDDLVFGEILRRDPRATLALLEGQFPSWSAKLRERFSRSMPDVARRVVFVPQQPPDDFSRLLASVDVLLDPLHFSGGDTSFQSFAVGTPIVTLPGSFLRSRITCALYRAMGLTDGVATSREDYVARAVRLGTDRGLRDRVRSEILRANSAIFESEAGLRDLENFLLDTVAAAWAD